MKRHTPRLTPAQQALVSSNYRLAYWTVCHGPRWWRRLIPDIEERISEALFALCMAAAFFDPQHGSTFAAYATKAIWRRLNVVSGYYHRNEPPPAKEITQTDYGQDNPVAQIPSHRFPSPEKPVEDADLFERVRATLPRDWFDLLWEEHAEGLDRREIGQRRGVSGQAIANRLTLAHRYLRLCLVERMAVRDRQEAG